MNPEEWGAIPVQQNAPQAAVDPATWGAVPVEPVSATQDVLKTIPAGLARGVTGLIGLPGTVQGWIGEGINRAGEAAGFKRANLPDSPLMPTGETVTRALEENVTGELYKPQTRPGRYANSAAEFTAGALGPGGALGNIIKYGVIPGLGSEFAGEMTAGTKAEPFARVAGAIVPAAAANVLTRPSTARAVSQYAEGATPQQVRQAEALFTEAQNLGVPITRAEAIQHVTQNGTRMGDMQRVVEGQGQLRPEMAQRPAQNAQAFGRVVDDVQPQPTTQPSNIGPQATATGQQIAGEVRGAINQASEPFYQAARQAHLSPADMALVRRQVPGFNEALAAVRNDVQLNRTIAQLPDNNVAVLNEVKKYLDQQSTNAASPLNPAANQQRSAGYGQDAQAVRQAAENVSPEYATALQIQSQARERYLDPLLNGPIGKLAQKDQTTKGAIEALFPTNPNPNSAQEIANAVTALGQRSPNVARDLVRAHLESVFNESAQNLIGGANQYGGAKFAANLRGNPQQAANLEAAIRALPNGNAAWPGVDRYLQILEAQGTRQRIGSQTAFNQEMLQDLRGGSVAGNIAKGANITQIPRKLTEVWERWRLGRNVDELARLLTDPRAAREFERLATVPQGSAQSIALLTRLTYLGQSAASKSPPKP